MKKYIVFVLIVLLIFPATLFSKSKKEKKKNDYWLKRNVYSGLKFRSIGPSLMSGRISDIAVHPENSSIWYVTAGSGGVWKTENAGITWKPIFDNYSSYSIGCITIDKNNPDTLWLGTGENVSGRHVGYGDGVYKSMDGGKTWKNMGLKESEHIGRIIVHPKNSNIVFVAAEGPLWSKGGERGLYKSEDGGKVWKHVLKISENTGVTDVEIDPSNPNIMYAAAYMRRRSVSSFLGGGPESGIYKSVDGGNTWRKLKKGLPKGNIGKIGLAVSPIKPNVVYATIEADKKNKGFYKSENKGESFKKQSDYISGGTGPHYYQEIYADPNVFDRVYQMDVYMRVTNDGGKTFERVGEKNKHVDNHSLAIFKNDSNHLVAGCDGGVYESFDKGKTWRFFNNLPLTQFYKISLDNSFPFYNVHGGAQDNSSQLGPSRTLNVNGILNSDWIITSGADGYGSQIHENNNLIFCTWQNGSIQRYDKLNGQLIDIKPQAKDPKEILRWNWDAPFIISPNDSDTLYMGANKVFKTTDNGNSWKCISPDLTRNVFRLDKKIMDKTWSVNSLWDHMAMSQYSTLTAISESPLKKGMIAVGSDDGLINLTLNDGENWKFLKLPKDAPKYFFVNDLKLSLHSENVIYAVLDNHKTGDFKPYVYKSSDKGETFENITSNLPKRLTVWSIEEDSLNSDLLFIGTEFGIYFTIDSGKHWNKFSSGLPTVPFRDLEIMRRENDLVCGSFGRGIYILDDYSPLRFLNKELLQKEGYIFPIKKAYQYIERRPLGGGGKASQGGSFFVAENPKYGAVITYYLKDGFKSKKKVRLEKEKKLLKEKKDIPFPGWKKLEEEKLENKLGVFMYIKDTKGNLIRKLSCIDGNGIHRIAWDLRFQSTYPIRKKGSRRWKPKGPLVIPGNYTATLVRENENGLKEITKPIEFQVEYLGKSSLPDEDRETLLEYQQKAAELQRVMFGTISYLNNFDEKLDLTEKALISSTCQCEDLIKKVRNIKKDIFKYENIIYGDRVKNELDEPSTQSLFRMLNLKLYSTAKLTEKTKDNYDYVKVEFKKIYEGIKEIVDVKYPQIEKEMENRKVPWNEGRKLPKFNF